jgi:hypothetical protein
LASLICINYIVLLISIEWINKISAGKESDERDQCRSERTTDMEKKL